MDTNGKGVCVNCGCADGSCQHNQVGVAALVSHRNTRWVVVAAIAALALWGAVEAASGLKEFRYIGAGVSASNTISVSGEGEVFAVPDIATFSVGVTEEAGTVAEAQDAVNEQMDAIVSFLKGEGIEDRDIKTTGYNVYPRYEYPQTVCSGGYCPPTGERNLVGFEVSQTLSVKVRDTESAGDILSGVGALGATDVSGLSFTIDDEDTLIAEAREKAIADAREKARQLAADLDVKLVRVVGFSENGGYPEPYYARAEMAYDSAAGMGGAATTKATLPTGENRIVSNVYVTYEIR